MPPNPTPPIERRPMTTKQARRKWQKKGCPTISSAEQKKLKRAAELEDRAQSIRDKEKRVKENALRRKEKDEREKEKRKRMGIEENVKLPEGQLGLGQFFAARASNIESKKQDPLKAKKFVDDAIPYGKQTGVDENLNLRNEQNLIAVKNSSKKESRFCNIASSKEASIPSEANAPKKGEPVSKTTTPEPEFPMHNKRKAVHDQTCTRQGSAKRRSFERLPLKELGCNVPSEQVDQYKPRSVEGALERPCKKTVDAQSPPECDQSEPSDLSKPLPANCSQGSTRRPGTQRIASIIEFPERTSNVDNVHIPFSTQCLSSSQSDPQESLGGLLDVRTKKLSQHNDLEQDHETANGLPAPQSNIMSTVTESFGGGVQDCDLLDLDDVEENVVDPGLPQGQTQSSTKITFLPLRPSPSFPVPTNNVYEEPTPVKAMSSESFIYDFCTQDMALLDDSIDEPTLPRIKSAHANSQNTVRQPGLILKQGNHSTVSKGETNQIPSSDSFCFAGCTQELEALIDETEHTEAAEVTEETAKSIPTKITMLPPRLLPTSISASATPLAAASMATKPLSVINPAQRIGFVQVPPAINTLDDSDDNDDEFDCFKGSTQALLEL